MPLDSCMERHIKYTGSAENKRFKSNKVEFFTFVFTTYMYTVKDNIKMICLIVKGYA